MRAYPPSATAPRAGLPTTLRRRASVPGRERAALPVVVACLVVALVLAVNVGSAAARPAPARASATVSGKVYFTAGEQFAAVTRQLPAAGRQLPTAIAQLLAGPTAAERRLGLGSAIPRGSKVLSTSFDAGSGVAAIRFDARFAYTAKAVTSRAEAISEYYGRAGEVVFTATALPGVKAVRLSVPGRDAVTLRRSGFARPAQTAPETAPPAVPSGSKPVGTRAIQQSLVRLTYLPASAATGTYDDRTRQAIQAFQGWQGLARDGIAGPRTTAALAAATVPRPLRSLPGRSVEIHRAKGVVLLISGGKVTRAIHTSTGRGGDAPDLGTPPGRFKIYRKEQSSWSVPYRVWLPYAAYWDRGWALHGYKDVPVQPASAGCARLPLTEAPVVYAFVQIGTPVTVF